MRGGPVSQLYSGVPRSLVSVTAGGEGVRGGAGLERWRRRRRQEGRGLRVPAGKGGTPDGEPVSGFPQVMVVNIGN